MQFSKFSALYRLDDDHFLLINSLTGALDLLDSKTAKKISLLSANKPSSLEVSLINELKDRGHIYGTSREEDKLVKELLAKYNPNRKKTLKFILCPSFGCNLSCSYCFESQTLRSSNATMTRDQIDAAFFAMKSICDIREPNAVEVGLFGGEPLLKKNFGVVETILRKSSAAAYPLGITTNGVNLTKYLPLLQRFKDTIFTVQVTLDGTELVHNARRAYSSGKPTFNAIVKGISGLVDSGIKVRIRVNVDDGNLANMPDFADFLAERGWNSNEYVKPMLTPVTDHIDQSRLSNFLREDKMLKKISDLARSVPKVKEIFEIKAFRILGHLASSLGVDEIATKTPPAFYFCEASMNQFYVFGPDDQIYPCPESIGNESASIGTYHPNLVISDERYNQWKDRNFLTIPKCRKCRIGPFCGGGCAYAALTVNGSTMKPVCNSAQEIIEDYLSSIKEELLARVG